MLSKSSSDADGRPCNAGHAAVCCANQAQGRQTPFGCQARQSEWTCGALQIQMREDVMPQTVLAIATGRLGREMLRRDDSYEGELSGVDPTSPAR